MPAIGQSRLLHQILHGIGRLCTLLQPMNQAVIFEGEIIFGLDGVVPPHLLDGGAVPLPAGVYHDYPEKGSVPSSHPFHSYPCSHCLLLQFNIPANWFTACRFGCCLDRLFIIFFIC